MPPLLALLLVVFALVGLFSTLSWRLSRSLRPPKPLSLIHISEPTRH